MEHASVRNIIPCSCMLSPYASTIIVMWMGTIIQIHVHPLRESLWLKGIMQGNKGENDFRIHFVKYNSMNQCM